MFGHAGSAFHPATAAPVVAGGEHQAGGARGGNEQHGDLAERVERAEVDDDRVDNVVGAGLIGRATDELAAGRRRGLPGGADDHRAERDQHAARHRDERFGQLHDGPGVGAAELRGQPSQHEHERHQRQGLDEELRQRQVWRAVHHEQPPDAIADHPDQQHRSEPTVRPDQRNRGHDHHDPERDLHRGVVEGLRVR